MRLICYWICCRNERNPNKSIDTYVSNHTRFETTVMLIVQTVNTYEKGGHSLIRDATCRQLHATIPGCHHRLVGIEEQFIRIGGVAVGQGDDGQVGELAGLEAAELVVAA